MDNIRRRRGLNRNSEVVIYDSGEKRVRCYTKMNPHYYKDEKGDLNPIDVCRVDITSAGVGDINLKSHNIVSLGIRRDGSTEKYLGMRPDETQALGTEQLEFSIVDVNFNGNKVPIDLSSNEIKTPNVMDFGSVVVHNTRQRSRQMVKVVGDISDFTIKYRIDMKGLEFTNKLTTKVNEVLRPNTAVKSTELGAVDSTTFIEQVSKDSKGFEIISGCITNDHLWLTSNPQRTYSDVFPDGYSIHRWGIFACHPVSAKNNVEIVIKECPFAEDDLSTTIRTILLQITGGRAVGLSIIKDDKVVALWGQDVISKVFWVHIVCEAPDYTNFDEGDIVDNMAAVGFKASEITSAFLTTFNKAVNKKAIVLDGEYIEADIHNRFTIVNSKGEFKFFINKPKLLDVDFEVVSDDTIHTLQKISDGVYEYIKYPDLNCFVGSTNITYIDAETCYSSTSDGWAGSPLRLPEWDTAHDHVGSHSNNINANIVVYSRVTDRKGTQQFRITRGFLYFDTTAIVEPVVSCSQWQTHITADENGEWSEIHAYLGTQGDPITELDFTEFGVVSYGSVMPVDETTTEIVYNGVGINAIVLEGETKVCVREYDHDVLDVTVPPEPRPYYYQGGYRSTDEVGVEEDPYLEIEQGGTIMPIMSVC